MKIRLTFIISDFYYTAPIIVQKMTLMKNQILSISLFQNDNFISQIDLSSIPNFHHYNLLEWQYTLENFFQENSLSLEDIKMDRPFFNMVNLKNTKIMEGELLFIIESILFSVIENLAPKSLEFIKKMPIKINGLYNSAYSNLFKNESLPDCIKIKIRPTFNNLFETIELVKNLLKAKPDIQIRFDGNRSFELAELLNYIDKLERGSGPSLFSAISYLEEPLRNVNDLHSFHQVYSYPIALDESLIVYTNNLDQLKHFPAGLNLIVKPSLFGISKSFEILKYASQFKHNVIISASYESATAIRPLMFLAAMNPNTYHGLDTLKFLPNELSIETANYSLYF